MTFYIKANTLEVRYAVVDDTTFTEFEIETALKKQIPKKVCETCGIYSCPSCHIAHDRRKKRYLNFCPNCGQRLGWRENK